MPYDYTAKSDKGKPPIHLVPTEIIRDIAYIREYGVKKYTDPDNWKRVEKERYIDALMRHLLLYIEDPQGLDSESHLPHLWHAACNIAFLCELQKDDYRSAPMKDYEAIEEIKQHIRMIQNQRYSW